MIEAVLDAIAYCEERGCDCSILIDAEGAHFCLENEYSSRVVSVNFNEIPLIDASVVEKIVGAGCEYLNAKIPQETVKPALEVIQGGLN